MDDATILAELLPTAERLVDRHLGMAKEWFPHDLVEWRPPPTPTAAGVEPLPDGVASALFVNVLTEDNLPYYFAAIDGLFGRHGAWGYWTRRWTAEEGRHSIALRDYLIMSGHIDPTTLERARMAQVTGGVSPQPTSISDAFAYLALQELATRIAHHNTGKALPDAEGYGVMKRVAADENLHYLFYRDLVSAALEIDPSGMVEAIKRQVIGFEMPGTGITGFSGHAKAIARAGIYDLRVHHDSILRPVVLGHWDIAERQGLTPSAEKARTRLLQFITRLGRASVRGLTNSPAEMVEASSR
ncbi:MAG TPA: acyl-ACP desaturase [Acidimicrobiales bacterium]|nr:acyl-ACP desaturase [Acidimicrobiales bacterium]